MHDTEAYTEAVIRLEAVKRQLKELEAEEKELSDSIRVGRFMGIITDDVIKTFGLVPATRTGGYDEGIIVLLKEKGFRDAIILKEVIDQKEVRGLVESQQLTEAEVEPYKKGDSVYFSLPKGKGAK